VETCLGRYYQPFHHVKVCKQRDRPTVDLMCTELDHDGVEYGLRFVEIEDGSVDVAILTNVKHDSRYSHAYPFLVKCDNVYLEDIKSGLEGVTESFTSDLLGSGPIAIDDPKLGGLVTAVTPELVVYIVDSALRKMKRGGDGESFPHPDALIAILQTVDADGDLDVKKSALLRRIIDKREGYGFSLGRLLQPSVPGVSESSVYYKTYRENLLWMQSALNPLARDLLCSLEATCVRFGRDSVVLEDLRVRSCLSIVENKYKHSGELSVLRELLGNYQDMSATEKRIVEAYVGALVANSRIDFELTQGKQPHLLDVINRDRCTSTLLRYAVPLGLIPGTKTRRVLDRIIEIGT